MKHEQCIQVRIGVNPVRILKVLVALSVGLAVASVATNVAFRLAQSDPDQFSRYFFDIDTEANLPTWFNDMELFVAALVAALVGWTGGSAHARKYRRMWNALGVIVTLMSIDELASIHENTSGTIHERLGVGGGLLYYAWVVPGIAAVVVVCVVFMRFALALPRHIGRLFAVSAGAYVFSAAVLEMVDGAVNGGHASPLAGWKITVTTLQELGEMSAVALAIYALLLMLGWSDEPQFEGAAGAVIAPRATT